jgi:cytochrome c biogenesis protein
VATDTIRVNHPLSYKGIRFYQAYDGPAVSVGVNEIEGEELFNGGVALDQTLYTSGYLHYIGFFALPDKGLTVRVIKAGTRSGNPIIPAGHIAVDVREGGNQIALQLIELGVPEIVSGMEFTFIRESQYSGFQVSHDPTNSLIWIASALFIIGICAVLYFPYRQLWVRIEYINDNQGQLTIRTTDTRRDVSTGEFQKLVAKLRQELSGHKE